MAILSINISFIQNKRHSALHYAERHIFIVMLIDEAVQRDLFRPDVPQEHRFIVGAETNRFGLKIDAHSSGQGVGNHQRGTGQIVCPRVRVNSTFEVSVA